MLLSSDVEVVLLDKNIKKLKSRYLLEDNLTTGDIAKIPINILVKSSNYIVEVSCDYCGYILKMPYKKYILGISTINKSSCRKCFPKKSKDIFLFKFGVDNPFRKLKN